ncbi:MAG: hypothetical protein U1A27_05485 [Phycisphaerae bacterium]
MRATPRRFTSSASVGRWDAGERPMNFEKDLVAIYTLMQRAGGRRQVKPPSRVAAAGAD